jgi:hypothetical protein
LDAGLVVLVVSAPRSAGHQQAALQEQRHAGNVRRISGLRTHPESHCKADRRALFSVDANARSCAGRDYRHEIWRSPDGACFPLIDGGAFDWLRKVSANDKLAFVASGMGSQLAAYAFRNR